MFGEYDWGLPRQPPRCRSIEKRCVLVSMQDGYVFSSHQFGQTTRAAPVNSFAARQYVDRKTIGTQVFAQRSQIVQAEEYKPKPIAQAPRDAGC
jgi:hypothetical protein